ncbi:MAG TPA: hypothetical protein VHV51_15065, partial [Polyangiaceae bacterium]|nr:hypothetical protein [Polyangiaceae bacterium]
LEFGIEIALTAAVEKTKTVLDADRMDSAMLGEKDGYEDDAHEDEDEDDFALERSIKEGSRTARRKARGVHRCDGIGRSTLLLPPLVFRFPSGSFSTRCVSWAWRSRMA